MSIIENRITAAFQRLAVKEETERPSTPGYLRVDRILPERNVYAALTAENDWAFVVATALTDTSVTSTVLENITAEYGGMYTLVAGGTERRLRASIIRCSSRMSAMRELFIEFGAALIDGLPPQPTDYEVDERLSAWAQLFRRQTKPAQTSVVGLIGELTVLARVTAPERWVSAWHQDVNATIDFVFSAPEPLGVEVKATRGRARMHELSYSQLDGMGGSDIIFASVLVDIRESGVRMGDLVKEITSRISGDATRKLYSILQDIAGEKYEEYMETRFIRESTLSSLQFYLAEDVPAPVLRTPLAAGVSNIRFTSDLSSTTPIELAGFTPRFKP